MYLPPEKKIDRCLVMLTELTEVLFEFFVDADTYSFAESPYRRTDRKETKQKESQTSQTPNNCHG